MAFCNELTQLRKLSLFERTWSLKWIKHVGWHFRQDGKWKGRSLEQSVHPEASNLCCLTASLCLSPKRRLLLKIVLSRGSYMSWMVMSSHFAHVLKEPGKRMGEPALGRSAHVLPCGLISPTALSVLWCRNSIQQVQEKSLCCHSGCDCGPAAPGISSKPSSYSAEYNNFLFFLFPKGISAGQLSRKFSNLGPRFLGTTKSLSSCASLKLTSSNSQLGSWSGWQTVYYETDPLGANV